MALFGACPLVSFLAVGSRFHACVVGQRMPLSPLLTTALAAGLTGEPTSSAAARICSMGTRA
jgi:hypothetical protein